MEDEIKDILDKKVKDILCHHWLEEKTKFSSKYWDIMYFSKGLSLLIILY